jgi:hypothetical protein
VVYPPDGVVIPLNLAPLLFQWRNTLPGAWFHLRLEGSLGSLDLYTSNPNRVSPGSDAWRRLLQAHAGQSLTVTLESVASMGAERHVAVQRTMVLADADLTATVYYWALNVGRIVRIEANSLTPNVLPMNSAGGQECFACHALSNTGRRLAFTFYGGNQPGGVVDPANPEVNLIGPDTMKKWNFAAISPDDGLLLTNYSRQLTVRDGVSGEQKSGVSNPIASEVAHPAWSPTGGSIAYASSIADANGAAASSEIDFDRSDLTVREMNALTGVPGAVQRLIPGNGDALYYPNFSPQSLFVVYNRGTHSRSGRDDIGQVYPATLELVDLATDDAPVTLERANPDADSYLATFSPFVEGGYLWVAFFSRRDYGVVLEGHRRRQIWVAAIDQNPQPGVDPSHPAFWLPGQDVTTENMSSFFAPVPCVDVGELCETDQGCCDGSLCRPNVSGQFVCTPPDEACGLPGDACTLDEDCCAGAGTCFDSGTGVKACTPAEDQCRAEGEPCQFNDDCCVNAGACFGGSGTFICTPPDAQCVLNGAACTTDLDCCVGAGTCFFNPEGEGGQCLTSDQRCATPTETCSTRSDCCNVEDVECLTYTQTGTKACLTPAEQCRSDGEPCLDSAHCCGQQVCTFGECGAGG